MATVHHALRDLTTGKIVSISRPVSFDAWPFRIADPNTVLWRYGDYWKFKGLFSEHKLYFRRADQLPDRLEGRFTEANKKQISDLCAGAFEVDPERETAGTGWLVMDRTGKVNT